MTTVYKTPDEVDTLTIRDDLEAVLSRHERFKPIVDFELKIDILLAYSDKDDAVKLHGAPALAKIKVVGPEDRARGNGDVRIVIDGAKYERRNERQRHAILCHELYHIAIKTHAEIEHDLNGDPRRVQKPDLDPYERPVVKLIPDDWSVTGFRQVAEWYGNDSAEVRSHRAIGELLGQLVMPFVMVPGPQAAIDVTPAKPAVGRIVEGTFAALLTVGHTAEQARARLDRLPASVVANAKSVSELIDVIYRESPLSDPPAPAPPPPAAGQPTAPDAGETLPDGGRVPLRLTEEEQAIRGGNTYANLDEANRQYHEKLMGWADKTRADLDKIPLPESFDEDPIETDVETLLTVPQAAIAEPTKPKPAPEPIYDIFLVYGSRQAKTPVYAVRAPSYVLALEFVKSQHELTWKGRVMPDDGTQARLRIPITSTVKGPDADDQADADEPESLKAKPSENGRDIPIGQSACSRCNVIRPRSVVVCPQCGNLEFCINPDEPDPPKSAKRPGRKRLPAEPGEVCAR